MAENPGSVTQSLDRSRLELLDLTARNRLLNTPVRARNTKFIHVLDELSVEVFRTLVTNQRRMTFVAGKQRSSAPQPDDDPDLGELPQPEETETGPNAIAVRHADARLQTQLTSEGLQKRLLSLFYDAETFIQEQGVNILYIALGMLRWVEADDPSAIRYAPILLVPVALERATAAEKFRLRANGEEPQHNLTLYAKLDHDFGIKLPPFPELEDLDLAKYFDELSAAIDGRTGWGIEPDRIVLGFFSFAKFLMYRDLDHRTWPGERPLQEHELISGLFRDGFQERELSIPTGALVDQHVRPGDAFHVVDADSSQTCAIHEAMNGLNLVIQGPPGTGKSQTITNLIAAAVQKGKRVLFLAEKMAALDVVKRRMDRIGLGPLCLELHSHKAQKRAVLEELRRTKELGRPAPQTQAVDEPLARAAGQLNNHAGYLHESHSAAGLTAYQVVGELVRLHHRGVAPSPISLPNAVTWTPNQVRERRASLLELASRAAAIGLPAGHPFRGVTASSILRSDLDLLRPVIAQLNAALQTLDISIEQASSSAAVASPATIGETKQLSLLLQHLAAAPAYDKATISNPAWRSDFSPLLNAGRTLSQIAPRIHQWFTAEAWSIDPRPMRRTLDEKGRGFLRLLSGEYRTAKQKFESISAASSGSLDEMLSRLDVLWQAQEAKAAIAMQAEEAQRAFGGHWNGERSDWQQLEAQIKWYAGASQKGLGEDWPAAAAREYNAAQYSGFASAIDGSVSRVLEAFDRISQALHLDLHAAFDCENASLVPLAELKKRVEQWASNLEPVTQWIAYDHHRRTANELGLAPLADAIHAGHLNDETTTDAFDSIYALALLRAMAETHPELAHFDGTRHSNAIEQFRKLDQEHLLQNRVAVLHKHFEQIPRANSGFGPLGILNGEMAKRRRHLPIRQLLKQTGHVVQQIKPVFMMSPLSVAQFLEPGSVSFDLLVIDEASQIQPVDALGAMARASQIVVVGDDKQLPPTRFFSRVVNEELTDEEDATVTADVESILGLCKARGLPERMLRWHYRSKHQSLIAVSNREFYEDKLFVVPSPFKPEAGIGLKFHHLPEGVFDSGGTGANRIEARTVAHAVMAHARTNPELSLGVGTFSIRQRQAILDELEILRRQDAAAEEFFSPDAVEPFFVKNLENIQGDERDVIFISVGYGKDSSGKFAMRFGPLSNDGGERRLNVLISRAKRRCEVFSGMTADQIDLERAKGRGVAAFKTFLHFAQSGNWTQAAGASTQQSTFEQEVAKALRKKGYTVETTIGISGFFIDVAVCDPAHPGRYLLGIECDGANYNRARSARDRDRLRQSVLQDHGWILHRIWSMDWYQRPAEQLQKTIDAIEAARNELAAREAAEPPKPKLAVTPIEREQSEDAPAPPVQLYREASPEVPRRVEPHEVPRMQMMELVIRVVDVEGPVHGDEIIARLRDAWQLARAGNRVQTAIRSAIEMAVNQRRLSEDGEFYSVPSQIVLVRDRSSVESSGLKKPELLPPAEVRAAILKVIEDSMGATRSEVAVQVGRLFGLKNTAKLRGIVDEQLARLEDAEAVVEKAGYLQLA